MSKRPEAVDKFGEGEEPSSASQHFRELVADGVETTAALARVSAAAVHQSREARLQEGYNRQFVGLLGRIEGETDASDDSRDALLLRRVTALCLAYSDRAEVSFIKSQIGSDKKYYSRVGDALLLLARAGAIEHLPRGAGRIKDSGAAVRPTPAFVMAATADVDLYPQLWGEALSLNEELDQAILRANAYERLRRGANVTNDQTD